MTFYLITTILLFDDFAISLFRYYYFYSLLNHRYEITIEQSDQQDGAASQKDANIDPSYVLKNNHE